MESDGAIRSIGESFDGIAIAVRRSVRSAAAELADDLQPAAWAVFREVVGSGRVQASTIVTSLGMDKSAVSRHLKELRERELVGAERDGLDARAVWVTPTPVALQRYARIVALQQERLATALAGWAEDDVERFAQLLARFSSAVSAPSAQPGAAESAPMSDSRQDDTGPDAEEVVPGERHPADQDRTGGTADVASAPAAQPRDGGRDTTA